MTPPDGVNEPLPEYVQRRAGYNANVAGATKAMHRAAERARRLALQTGTCIVVARGGEVIRARPALKEKA
jgi:hypothetical protein